MTQEEKSLLIKDLCARLPYGVKLKSKNGEVVTLVNPPTAIQDDCWNFKPYLRPMSSMTEEEKDNLQSLHDIISDENYGDGYSPSAWNAITEWEDYCNARHLDYRGLIPMGLALEATNDMYKIE